MANKKISDLAANTTPATTALIEVEDASASGKTTIDELKTAMGITAGVAEADFGLYRRVRVAISIWDGSITLATDIENGDTVDSVVLSTGDVVLVAGQVSSENGPWVVAASGAPSRPTWFPAAGSANGTMFFVEEGTKNATRLFECTNPVATDTIDTHALTFRVVPMHHDAAGSGAPAGDGAGSEGINDGYYPGDTYTPNNQENQVWIATTIDAGDLLWTEITGYRTTSETTTSRTIADSDLGSLIVCNNASDIVITVNTGLATGKVDLLQIGAGQVVVSAGTATRAIAAVFRLASTTAKTAEQYSPMTLLCGGSTVYITGDLELA